MSSRYRTPTLRTRSRGRTAGRPRAARRFAPAAAEQVANPEQVAQPAQDVLEVREDGGVEPRAAARGPTDPSVAETIVQAALIPVGQHGVRLGGFLELFFGSRVAGIAVRMVVERQFAVGALDILFLGVALNAENLVVVRVWSRFGHLHESGPE